MEGNFSDDNISVAFRENISENGSFVSGLSSLEYRIGVSVALAFIVFTAILGNLLVVIAFSRNRSLRKPTNYFLVNLAVADLALGSIVLPLSATYEVTGVWVFGADVCLLWSVVDILVSTASILNLVAISADRYLAISNPLTYHKIATGKRVVIVITLIWLVSLAISVPPLLGWRSNKFFDDGVCLISYSTGYVIYSAVGSFYIPFITMSVLYCKIYKVANRHMKEIKKTSTVGSLTDIDTDIERSEGSLFSTSVRHGRRMTSSSSGYSSGKYGPRQLVAQNSQIFPSTTDSRFTQTKFNLPDQQRFLLLCPQSTRSSRSSDSISESGLRIPSDSVQSSRSSSDSYALELELLRECLNQGLQLPQARSISNASSSSRRKRAPIRQRIYRFLSERNAAKTVSVIVGAFMVCWTPFSIVYLLSGICESCNIHPLLYKICFWLGYANSVLNPVIYTVFNQHIKRAMIRLLSDMFCCRCCRARRYKIKRRAIRATNFGSFQAAEEDWPCERTVIKTKTSASLPKFSQNMPASACPVQVFINAPKKSQTGSIVSWSIAALQRTLQNNFNDDGPCSRRGSCASSDCTIYDNNTHLESEITDQNIESYDSPSFHSAQRCVTGLQNVSSLSNSSSPRQRKICTILQVDTWQANIAENGEVSCRRSSRIPSLEDIQETFSQGTGRSSEESGEIKFSLANSADQSRKCSSDGTRSSRLLEMTIEEPQRELVRLVSQGLENVSSGHYNPVQQCIFESGSQPLAKTGSLSAVALLTPNQDVVELSNTPDFQERIHIIVHNVAKIGEEDVALKINSSSQRIQSIEIILGKKPSSSSLHSSHAAQSRFNAAAIRRAYSDSQLVVNKRKSSVLVNRDKTISYNSNGNTPAPLKSQQVVRKTLHDETSTGSESLSTPFDYLASEEHATVAYHPELCRLSERRVSRPESLLNNIINWPTTEANYDSLDGSPTISSQSSSLELFQLFDLFEFEHSSEINENSLTVSNICDIGKQDCIESVNCKPKLKRSHSEPVFSFLSSDEGEPSAESLNYNCCHRYLQTRWNHRKHSEGEMSFVNTDYTFEGESSVIGTEYDGGNSQKMSIESESPENNHGIEEEDLESEGEDTLPAIHLTEDDTTTILHASRRQCFRRMSAPISRANSVHMKSADVSVQTLDRSKEFEGFEELSSVGDNLIKEESATHSKEAVDWLEANIPRIQWIVNRCVHQLFRSQVQRQHPDHSEFPALQDTLLPKKDS